MADRRRPLTPKIALGELSPGRKLSTVSMETYPGSRERAALRCGLHDATIIADQVARKLEVENTVRGRLTKKGVEHVAVAKLIADLIWLTYQEVEVPRG